MWGENASQTTLPTKGDNDPKEQVQLPSFRTLLESLSLPCTLRYRLSESSTTVRNSSTCASSSRRALSPSVSASRSSGTHTDTASEIDGDENIEVATNQVARWIEEYHPTTYNSPNGSNSSSLSDLSDRYDAASPPNQTASEIGASEGLASKYSPSLPHHPPSSGGQLQPGGHLKAPGNLRYTARLKSFGPTQQVKIAKGALTTVLEPSQDDRSQIFTVPAASSARSVSPQTLPPEPQSGLASSSPAQTTCGCAMYQRSEEMSHQQANSAETRPAATYCVPLERPARKRSSINGTRSQNKSGSPDSAPTSRAPKHDVVVMNLAPALTFSSSVPRGRPPRAPDSDRFHIFRANDFRPFIWQEHVPPGHQSDQQERPRPRGAKRQRPTESLPAARKKNVNDRSLTSNSSKKRVTTEDTERVGARAVPEVDDGNPSLRTGAAMSHDENNDRKTGSSGAENLSGLPWYAVPRPSDTYIIVDSNSVASEVNKAVESTGGFSPSGRALSEEQVITDESGQEQQAGRGQLGDPPEHAPDREIWNNVYRSESDKASNGLPWYARRCSGDVYISVVHNAT